MSRGGGAALETAWEYAERAHALWKDGAEGARAAALVSLAFSALAALQAVGAGREDGS